MLVMLVMAFAVLTVGMMLQGWEAQRANGRQAGMRWLAGRTLLGLITCMGISLLLNESKLLWWVPPTGLGVDWQCAENVPPEARICFRH